MVKIFFGSIAILAFVVLGAFTAIFSPMMSGVNNNLGGHPQTPFHSPLPQPLVAMLNGAAGQATPSVLLTAILGLIALLIVYALGTLVAQGLRRWRGRRQMWTEMRWRGRVAALRADRATTSDHRNAEIEFESMWE